jgi:hypothetical protein
LGIFLGRHFSQVILRKRIEFIPSSERVTQSLSHSGALESFSGATPGDTRRHLAGTHRWRFCRSKLKPARMPAVRGAGILAGAS